LSSADRRNPLWQLHERPGPTPPPPPTFLSGLQLRTTGVSWTCFFFFEEPFVSLGEFPSPCGMPRTGSRTPLLLFLLSVPEIYRLLSRLALECPLLIPFSRPNFFFDSAAFAGGSASLRPGSVLPSPTVRNFSARPAKALSFLGTYPRFFPAQSAL